MLVIPSTMEVIAKAMTGRDNHSRNEMLDYYEKEAARSNAECRRIQGMLDLEKDRRQMCYEMFIKLGGAPVADPPIEFTEAFFKPVEEPVEADERPRPQLPEPAHIDIGIPGHKTRKGYVKATCTPGQYAAWYNLVHAGFGVYPPDVIGAAYYEMTQNSIWYIRQKATKEGLITHHPDKGNGNLWKGANVTVEDIKNKLGSYTALRAKFKEPLTNPSFLP